MTLAGCGGAGAPAPPQASHTRVPSNVLFWNAKVGLLLIQECGVGGHKCRSSDIELTTDGGHSYRPIQHLRNRNPGLETVGPSGAAATWGGSIESPYENALVTLDRGQSWKEDAHWKWRVRWATPQIGARSEVEKGYESLKIESTHDAGKTWQPLPNPCHMLGPIGLASLPSPSRWWLFCQGAPERGGPPDGARGLYSTVDAGKHWKLVGSAADGGIPASSTYAQFAPDGSGFLTGFPNSFATPDHGKTWTTLPAGLTPTAAFNGGVGFGVERGKPFPFTLLETHDSGHTWHVVRRWNG
jgi:photosystem II stability/assembly factor-like uncharacterized protein